MFDLYITGVFSWKCLGKIFKLVLVLTKFLHPDKLLFWSQTWIMISQNKELSKTLGIDIENQYFGHNIYLESRQVLVLFLKKVSLFSLLNTLVVHWKFHNEVYDVYNPTGYICTKSFNGDWKAYPSTLGIYHNNFKYM